MDENIQKDIDSMAEKTDIISISEDLYDEIKQYIFYIMVVLICICFIVLGFSFKCPSLCKHMFFL